MSNIPSLPSILQALLLASPSPITVRTLSEIAQEKSAVVQRCLEEMRQQWLSHEVLQLCQTGAGWQISIKSDFAPYLHRFFEQKPQKLSKAVLETLALIAYRGPITRSEIEEVRGVSVNPSTLRQLMDAQWVEITGQKDAPGKPQLFETTKKFLSDFQLRSLHDLPDFSQQASPTIEFFEESANLLEPRLDA